MPAAWAHTGSTGFRRKRKLPVGVLYATIKTFLQNTQKWSVSPGRRLTASSCRAVWKVSCTALATLKGESRFWCACHQAAVASISGDPRHRRLRRWPPAVSCYMRSRCKPGCQRSYPRLRAAIGGWRCVNRGTDNLASDRRTARYALSTDYQHHAGVCVIGEKLLAVRPVCFGRITRCPQRRSRRQNYSKASGFFARGRPRGAN